MISVIALEDHQYDWSVEKCHNTKSYGTSSHTVGTKNVLPSNYYKEVPQGFSLHLFSQQTYIHVLIIRDPSREFRT